jgi:hypothetical protein
MGPRSRLPHDTSDPASPEVILLAIADGIRWLGGSTGSRVSRSISVRSWGTLGIAFGALRPLAKSALQGRALTCFLWSAFSCLRPWLGTRDRNRSREHRPWAPPRLVQGPLGWPLGHNTAGRSAWINFTSCRVQSLRHVPWPRRRYP